MKILLIGLLMPVMAWGDDVELAEKISRHQTGTRDLSLEQDELAADVQQLTIEQTDPKTIGLFQEVEKAMDDAYSLLWDHETGGETIAAETDVIEKIFEAAKQRQQSKGQNPDKKDGENGDGSCSGSAMMDMLERMMGRKPGQQSGKRQAGNNAGQGGSGDSDAANTDITGTAEGKIEERTVPKGAGLAGRSLPAELQEALKAYNQQVGEISR